jgi:hypothetical protein
MGHGHAGQGLDERGIHLHGVLVVGERLAKMGRIAHRHALGGLLALR